MKPHDVQVRHHPELSEDVARRIRDLADDSTRVDGVAPLSEQPLLSLRAGAPTIIHLVAGTGGGVGDAGRLHGYAQVDLGVPGAASAELVVHPASRRHGLGSRLLAAAQEHAGDRSFAVWAHGNLPAAQALARSAGLRVVRELWQMRRDLDGPGAPRLPDGVSVRTFRPGEDEERWLEVNRHAFADHPEQGRLTRADLDARMAEPWFRAEDLLLAERDGDVVGFVWLKVVPGEADGELYVLGVHPAAQGIGLGRALTEVALRHLHDRGLAGVMLYVDGDNTAAIRTYTATGFERSALDVQYG